MHAVRTLSDVICQTTPSVLSTAPVRPSYPQHTDIGHAPGRRQTCFHDHFSATHFKLISCDLPTLQFYIPAIHSRSAVLLLHQHTPRPHVLMNSSGRRALPAYTHGCSLGVIRSIGRSTPFFQYAAAHGPPDALITSPILHITPRRRYSHLIYIFRPTRSPPSCSLRRTKRHGAIRHAPTFFAARAGTQRTRCLYGCVHKFAPSFSSPAH